MGKTIELTNQNREQIVFGKDSIVIQKYFSGIKGGRSLDVAADFPLDVIHAGHVIITDGAGTYKPMPIVAKTAVEGASSYVYTKVDADDMYEAVADPTGQNPYTKGWYTKNGTTYTKCADTETTPAANTTYYEAKNPHTEGWYTKAGSVYSATEHTEPQAATDYYVRSGSESAGTTVLVKDENGNQVYIYGSLPAGYAYAGVLYRSVKKSKPLAAIMTNGEVNSEALDIAIDNIKSAFQTACPHVVFIKDETEEEE